MSKGVAKLKKTLFFQQKEEYSQHRRACVVGDEFSLRHDGDLKLQMEELCRDLIKTELEHCEDSEQSLWMSATQDNTSSHNV